MESKIIQSLNTLISDDLPNFEAMTRKDLIEYIKNNCTKKQQIVSFSKALYESIQQSYHDAFYPYMNTQNSDISFEFQTFGGILTCNAQDGTFTFTPDEVLNRLFHNSESKCSTRLKTFLSSRLFKILKVIYILEENGELERFYKQRQEKLKKKKEKEERKAAFIKEIELSSDENPESENNINKNKEDQKMAKSEKAKRTRIDYSDEAYQNMSDSEKKKERARRRREARKAETTEKVVEEAEEIANGLGEETEIPEEETMEEEVAAEE